MLLIVHGKHHVQFDIRSRHHIAGIAVSMEPIIAFACALTLSSPLSWGRKIDRQIEIGSHELLAGLRRGRDGGVL